MNKLQDCSPLNLPGSLSSLANEAKVKVGNRSMAVDNIDVHDSDGIGGAQAPLDSQADPKDTLPDHMLSGGSGQAHPCFCSCI